MPSTLDRPGKHLLWAARLLTHTELQQQQQPGRASAVELLHMYLCRLFPAWILGIKADALNPPEACDSVPHQQGQANNSKYSVVRPEGREWRHTGHPLRSSPNLELVAVTLGGRHSHGSPQHPQPGTAQLLLRRPLQVPWLQQNAARSSHGSPGEGPLGYHSQQAGSAAGGQAAEEVRNAGDVESPAVSLGLGQYGAPTPGTKPCGPRHCPAPAGAHAAGRHALPSQHRQHSAGELRRCSLSQAANVTGKHGWKTCYN